MTGRSCGMERDPSTEDGDFMREICRTGSSSMKTNVQVANFPRISNALPPHGKWRQNTPTSSSLSGGQRGTEPSSLPSLANHVDPDPFAYVFQDHPSSIPHEMSQVKLPPVSSFMKVNAQQSSINTATTMQPSGHQSATLGSQATVARTPSVLSQMDMRLVYDNMMVGYFIPQPATSQTQGARYGVAAKTRPPLCPATKTNEISSRRGQLRALQTLPFEVLPSPPGSSNSPLESRCVTPRTFATALSPVPVNFGEQKCPVQPLDNSNKARVSSSRVNLSARDGGTVARCTTMDVTPSGCMLLDTSSLLPCKEQSQNELINALLDTSSSNTLLEKNCGAECVCSASSDAHPCNHHVPLMPSSVQSPTLSDMSSVFLTPQDTMMPPSLPPSQASFQADDSSSIIGNQSAKLADNSMNAFALYAKPENGWARFPALPSAMHGTAVSSNSSERENNSVSYISSNSSQPSFSPFPLNISDVSSCLPSSMFTSSPRLSGMSSYSGRGSRNKRALSNSPLSAEGIDLNTIIRTSPTSLVAYLNGSRSSSSCVSPGSAGDRTGCYGHLSARNSSSSPHSGSGSSGARRSIPYTPQIATSSLSLQRENSGSSNIKNDYMDNDSNMTVIQAMQALEEGLNKAGSCSTACNEMLENLSILPGSDGNLQLLPQDIAMYATEEYVPRNQAQYPTTLPPVPASLPQREALQVTPQPSKLPPPGKPPPTYDQHMARKATLQKNSSSDSSQPSNYSSFESSEGDRLGFGSSSTDSEQVRLCICRWMDCSLVFHDQDEFVTHIEKSHVDQRKGDDFICLWRGCPRNHQPFNARYKLLVHMRVHSGDKPNKCTFSGCKKAFSRLENLKIHMRSHTGERPYTCSHSGCNKTFSNSSDRSKHQRTHQDTRPYVCQVLGCGKRYTDPSSLRKHVKSNHAEKDQCRKKIRGGIEELDDNDLNECLVITSLRPPSYYDISPPEPTDSGLGRSPRSSQPGSSSDHYPGHSFSTDTSSRSGTQGSSSHTSPCSHHSSPSTQYDTAEREKLRVTNSSSSRRVPVLPPIAQGPPQPRSIQVITQNYSPRQRPQSLATPSISGGSSSSHSMTSPCGSTNGRICVSALTRDLVALPSVTTSLSPGCYGNTPPHCQDDYACINTEFLSDAIFEALSRSEGVS